MKALSAPGAGVAWGDNITGSAGVTGITYTIGASATSTNSIDIVMTNGATNYRTGVNIDLGTNGWGGNSGVKIKGSSSNGGNNSHLDLWINTANAAGRVMTVGNGVVFAENLYIRANGVIGLTPPSDLATGYNHLDYTAPATNANGIQSRGIQLNLGTRTSQNTGLLIIGTGGTATDGTANHLVLHGNTASNTNKVLSAGNGAGFTEQFYLQADGHAFFAATNTAAGTTGAQTINKPSGTVNFAAAASSLVVTNSLVTTASIIYCVLRTNDATARIANVVPAAGSFTINLTAATTAETSCGFLVIN